MKGKDSPQIAGKHGQKWIHIAILVLLIVLVAALLDINRVSGCENKQYSGTHNYTEASWIYRQGDKVLESGLEVPAFRRMKKGEIYSISTLLTYDGSQDASPTCFFFVDHMFCRVLLDGEVIFSYMAEDIEKPDHSKSPGNVYTAARLPHDCLGKELTIEFVPSLDADIEYQLPNPSFGDHATRLADLFRSELPHNIMALLSLILGFGSIFYATLVMTDVNYRESLFIGIFAILFGLYNITESDFDFYMISNPYFTYVLDYVTFSLIPIFFMASLREHLDTKQRRISLGLILVGLALFGTELTLHFTGVMDMREFLPITHVFYFTIFIVNLVLVATTKNKSWTTRLVLQLLPMLIGMVCDGLVYYMHWQLGTSDSTFTAIGVLLFLIAEIFHAWRYSMQVYLESIKSRVYKQMAFVDSLTGIGNHWAFEIEKDSLISGQKSCESLTVLVADLNDLKLTNDTLGHAAGDILICNAARVLTDFAADAGHAFRIGGDEFILFLYNISEAELEKRRVQMRAQIDKINETSDSRLDLAIGVQRYGGDLEETIRLADKKMYTDKAARKTARSRT